MKDTKRALRRHHRRRMIAHARHVLSTIYGREYTAEELKRAARRYHDHLKMCSCYLCGNRRKWGGPTLQERRMQQRIAHGED